MPRWASIVLTLLGAILVKEVGELMGFNSQVFHITVAFLCLTIICLILYKYGALGKRVFLYTLDSKSTPVIVDANHPVQIDTTGTNFSQIYFGINHKVSGSKLTDISISLLIPKTVQIHLVGAWKRNVREGQDTEELTYYFDHDIPPNSKPSFASNALGLRFSRGNTYLVICHITAMPFHNPIERTFKIIAL